MQEEIKQLQVFGGEDSSFFVEIREKLNQLQKVLQQSPKKSVQRLLGTKQKTIEFIALNEIDYLKQLQLHKSQYPTIFSISHANRQLRAYIIVNQKSVFFDLASFFEHYIYLKAHFTYVPLLNGEHRPNFKEMSQTEFNDLNEKRFRQGVSSGEKYYSYICIESKIPSSASSEQLETKQINLILELNKKLCPKTIENFTTLLEKDPRNNLGESLSYLDSKFTVKRKQFIQGGKQNVKGHTTIFGKYLMDESFSVEGDRAGMLYLVNEGGRDTNNSEFFITLEDISESNLRNVCFGRVLFGLDDLLALTSKVSDSETLNWRIFQCDKYEFNPRDFVQFNGISYLDQSVVLTDAINRRKQEIEEQKQQEIIREEKVKTRELAEQQKKAEEQFLQDKHSYTKNLYNEKRNAQKKVSISQSKHEFNLSMTLKHEILNAKDSDKNQPIEQYIEALNVSRTTYQLQLEEEYQKLMEQHVETMKKFEVQFPSEKEDQEYEAQQYKIQVRQDAPPQRKTQEQTIFSITTTKDYTDLVNSSEHLSQVFYENVLNVYPDCMVISDFQFIGDHSRIGWLQDKITMKKYVVKQFSSQQAFDEEIELRNQVANIISEKKELSELFSNVISSNQDHKSILLDSGECSLPQFSTQMSKQGYYWFQEKQKKQFNNLIQQLYKLVTSLAASKIYLSSNLRPENLALYYDSEYIDLKIKIIDIGNSSLEESGFQKVQQQISAYSLKDVSEYEFQSEDERLQYEYYTLGRVIMKVLNDSLNDFELLKNSYTEKLELINFQAFLEPYGGSDGVSNNKHIMEKLKGYYDTFHQELLQSLLIEKQKDKSKKIMDQLRKDAKNVMCNLYDYDELIRNWNFNNINEKCSSSDNSLDTVIKQIEHLQGFELYEQSLQIIKQNIISNKNQFENNAKIIYYKLFALNSLNWQNKIQKYVDQIQSTDTLTDIEKNDEEQFHQIYLLCIRGKYNDINNEEHMRKIETYLSSHNNYFIRKYGQNSKEHIEQLLKQGQVIQNLIGSVHKQQPNILLFRQNFDIVQEFILKNGNNSLDSKQTALNNFLGSYGYAEPSEDTIRNQLKNNEDAQKILEENNLQNFQLYGKVLQNINQLNFLTIKDEDILYKNQKSQLSYQQRQLGSVDPDYIYNLSSIVVYLSKNRQKQHATQFEITDLLQTANLAIENAHLSTEIIQKEELHTLRAQCNQENYGNHLKDALNKASELEQQQKYQKALQTLKSAQNLNNFHLEAKKDYEENKNNILLRIQIIRAKKNISKLPNLSTQKLQKLQEFQNNYESDFNFADVFFYLIELFPFHTIKTKENYQAYLLEAHKLNEKIDKMRQESKRWIYEYGVINFLVAHCLLKMNQRHIMSYYLHIIEEYVGAEYTNTGLLRKKNLPPLKLMERIHVAASALITFYYKPELPKFTYLNI